MDKAGFNAKGQRKGGLGRIALGRLGWECLGRQIGRRRACGQGVFLAQGGHWVEPVAAYCAGDGNAKVGRLGRGGRMDKAGF